MKYEIDQSGEVKIVRISAVRMTQDLLDDFRDQILQLIDGGGKYILLVMDRIDYLDSFGVGVIMEIYRRLSSVGGSLKLCGLQPRVSRMVAITNLDSVLDIFPSEDAAIRGFGENASPM